MIYEQADPNATLTQGDIIDSCPILFWQYSSGKVQPEPASMSVRVVVLTQACDLAQVKATRVLAGVVHPVERLVESGVLQPKVIRDQVRAHRVYGWYFLPAGAAVAESIVDLRDLHTIPRTLLENLIKEGKRVARIRIPFREHLLPRRT